MCKKVLWERYQFGHKHFCGTIASSRISQFVDDRFNSSRLGTCWHWNSRFFGMGWNCWPQILIKWLQFFLIFGKHDWHFSNEILNQVWEFIGSCGWNILERLELLVPIGLIQPANNKKQSVVNIVRLHTLNYHQQKNNHCTNTIFYCVARIAKKKCKKCRDFFNLNCTMCLQLLSIFLGSQTPKST